MYEQLDWANKRILQTLQVRVGSNENQQICQLFSHILLAEKGWMTRLQGLDSTPIPLWSDLGLEACEKLIQENEKSYADFLNRIAQSDLDQTISYTNSKGQKFTNTIQDILIHVALHGQYHRGQINLRLRSVGSQPVNVDFITFVRES